MTLAEAFRDDDLAALDALPVGNAVEAADTYGRLVGLVLAINAEIESDEARYSRLSEGLLSRLEKWIERLREKMAEITRVLGAVSFAITVGPLVTVTVTWPPEPAAGGA